MGPGGEGSQSSVVLILQHLVSLCIPGNIVVTTCTQFLCFKTLKLYLVLQFIWERSEVVILFIKIELIGLWCKHLGPLKGQLFQVVICSGSELSDDWLNFFSSEGLYINLLLFHNFKSSTISRVVQSLVHKAVSFIFAPASNVNIHC